MTRWYLQRHPAWPKLIQLVVEERADTKRGCMIRVDSRPHARSMLPILRQALQERIKSAAAQPQRTWDPVEDDDHAG